MNATEFCQQCAALNGGPIIEPIPDSNRTTLAAKALCGNCGYVFMDRQRFCCDAQCKIHRPSDDEIPQSDLVRLARPPAPNGNGTTVGAQPVAQPTPRSQGEGG